MKTKLQKFVTARGQGGVANWVPLKSVDLRRIKLGTEFWMLNLMLTRLGEHELVRFKLRRVKLTRWSEAQIDGRTIPGGSLVCLERVALRMINLDPT